MMSHSRDFCGRSHDNYSACAYHFHNKKVHGGKDWRTCEQCKEALNTDPCSRSRSWHSNNGFNSTPGLESDFPKGSFITAECDGCRGRIAVGWEDVTFTPDVPRRRLCVKCAPMTDAKKCANCLAPDGQNCIALKACARCKTTHYCGRPCQNKHWKAGHKELCVTPEGGGTPAAQDGSKGAPTTTIRLAKGD
jgi:hypothetical protein